MTSTRQEQTVPRIDAQEIERAMARARRLRAEAAHRLFSHGVAAAGLAMRNLAARLRAAAHGLGPARMHSR